MTVRSQKEPHRFFNAMVLMGGSLALGCGGATNDGEGTVKSGPTGSNTGGASEPKTMPSSVPSGGSPAQGTGGVPAVPGTGSGGTGGGISVASGGAAGSPAGAPTFDLSACPPNQWVCPIRKCPEPYRGGVVIPADCRCDPSLPVDVVCGPGERLACLHGTHDANGEAVRPVDFSCRCVADDTPCDACDGIFDGPTRMTCDEERFAIGQIICGCAVVYLR